MLAEERELPFHCWVAIVMYDKEVVTVNIFLGNDGLVTTLISGTLIPWEKHTMSSPKCFT